jgi:hypothetical protein
LYRSFSRTIKNSRRLNDCLTFADGTELSVSEHGFARKGNPFEPHKYARKSALRYELGVDIINGYSVWINGLAAS